MSVVTHSLTHPLTLTDTHSHALTHTHSFTHSLTRTHTCTHSKYMLGGLGFGLGLDRQRDIDTQASRQTDR